MAERYIYPVGDNRDVLELTRINEDSTVGEMIDTINSNFENLAKHGGGPAGIDGTNGSNGANGVNAEYIYARADVMIGNQHYPEQDILKESLFESVMSSATGHAPYNSTIEWYSHPQGVDSTHKNEYVLTRYKRGTDGSEWYYASEPVLWAHWGETGLDGDGVEYIFYRSKGELTSDEINNLHNNISLDKLTANQKVIYNLDDFYPGTDWFNNSNRNKAFELYEKSQLTGNFTTLWNNKFSFTLGWTDEPLGTTPIYKYEYVSIRKSTTEDGKKSWGTFSKPSLWSSYGYATRTFIIYYNGNETQPDTPSGGWWDVNEDKLITNKQGYKLTAGWSNTHTETTGFITWMSSGMFGHDGKNISWSDPVRITGENGKNGEDGIKMQFIYALTSDPKYPNTVEGINDLFDVIEGKISGRHQDNNGYYHTYQGTKWYDNALSISESDKEEYFASRTRIGVEGGSENWTPMMAPVLWARWGEDGTDGDGVEYIFHTSTSKDKNTAFTKDGKSLLPVKLENMSTTLGKYQKIIHNIDDFYPGEGWFDKPGQKDIVKQLLQDKLGESFSESDFNTQWDGTNKFGFNLGWTDNPQGTKASAPFEWVSIRKSTTPEGAKERVWGDFSEPKLWASYNVTAITFTVYCNVPEDVPAAKINDGEGKWKISNNSLVNTDNSTPFRYRAVSETLNNYFNLNKHIGVWEDDNYDVSPSDYPDGVSIMVKWAATGRFKEDGDVYGSNISWSKPMRITGEKGEPGADGDNTQYIYARIDKFVLDGEDAPIGDDETDKTKRDTLFDNVENSTEKCYTLEGYEIPWYDNPQGIDEDHKIEWIWSRQRKSGEDEWEYGDPVIWSRWGEDGTDGDGIEYIFFKTNQNLLAASELPNIEFDKENGTLTKLGKCQEVVYQFDDFYPNDTWFKDTRKVEIFEAIEAAGITIADSNEEDTIWTSLKNSFDIGWTDNPSGVDAYSIFEWVSIRKGKPDKNGKRVWEPFGEPKIWARFNIRTRDFIVYCNVEGENSTPEKPQNDAEHCRYIGYWEDGSSPEFRISGESSLKFKSNALPNGQLPKKGSTEEQSNDPSEWTNSIGYWEDTNKDVPNTIAWMCTGTFSEKGNNISWSEPFRITGYKGQPGADGSNIEFIYTLSDDEPKYPKYNDSSDYNTVNDFFNAVESAGINGYQYKSDPNNPEETPTIWYDNAQAIADEDGKRKEWVWSRSKAAGASTTNWTFAPKPVIWAHWGEDGTDGDGIEYIFARRREEWAPNSSTWTTATQITSDIEKAMYSIGDFVPYVNWFTNDNKTKVQNILIEKNQYNYNTDEEFDTAWSELTNKWSFNQPIESGRTELGTWSDNPNSIGPEWRYQYVSVRKMSDGVWGPFSYPKLWSKYSLSKFTAFAFITLHIDEDISNLTPEGGTYLNPIPNDLKRTNEGITNCTVNESGISWTDTPQVPDETEVVWMSSAQFDEGTNGPSTSWSAPQRMVDSATFNVEWSSNDLTRSEIEQINEVLSGKNSSPIIIDSIQRYSTYFNFGTVLKELSYQVDAAEAEWRDRINKLSYALTGKYLIFGDDTGNAVLMATCQLKNGEWSNWVIKRIKGEQGEKGDPGTSINVKGKIIYEVYFDSDETVYNYNNAESAMQAYIAEKFASESPSENGLLIVYPKSLRETYNDYWGEYPDGKLYMWKYENGTWYDFNNTDKTTYDNRQEEGDCYTSLNKHLILWDGDSWQDAGELQGPEGSRWILVIKYANGTPGDREFVANDSDIPSAEWIGTFMYLDDGTDYSAHLNEANYTASGDSTTERGWIWSLFKGQDGHGLEYIFKATSDNQPPYVPNTSTSENREDDFVPSGWSDEPIEPTPEAKYVWMCWRKFNTLNQTWTKFMGVDKKTYDENGVARLWQVFVKTITEVKEYFHADELLSPADNEFTSPNPENQSDYWYSDRSDCGWDETNRYLFNVEVVKYSYGLSDILQPHFIATYEDGVKDIIDYYCLGTNGETAPARDLVNSKYTPIYFYDSTFNYIPNDWTSDNNGGYVNKTEGIDYWTTNAGTTKINETYRYLWNITLKIYEGDKQAEWGIPTVIGVYNLGENGKDAVYADLDNEMDTVQIDDKYQVISKCEYMTNVRMYKGSEPLKIKKCEISAEEAITPYCWKSYVFGEGDDDWYEENHSDSPKYRHLTEDSITYIHDLPTDQYAEYVNISFRLFVPKAVIAPHNVVTITVTGEDDTVRMINYTLVGLIHPAIYQIIPSVNAVLFNSDTNSVDTTEPISITVRQKIGSETQDFTEVSSTDPFILSVKKNNGEEFVFNNGHFTYPSMSDLHIGDKLTFEVKIDANSDDGDGYETVADRETVYVLNEGKDGAKGPAGKGYEYRYIRKEGATSCSLINQTPEFAVLVSDSWVSGEVSTIAGGADSTYQYEWRSERTTNSNGTWEPWSDPITIARYFDTSDMDTAVASAINNQSSEIATIAKNGLTDELNRLSTLSGYFDASGYLNCSGINSNLLNGYIQYDSLGNALTSVIAGVEVSADGKIHTFSDYMDSTNNKFTTVGQSINAINNSLENYVLSTDLSGEISSAMDTFRADVTDNFATMDRAVANVTYSRDKGGYLLIEKTTPIYGTLKVESLNSSHPVYIIPESNISVEEIMTYLTTGKGIDNLSDTVNLCDKDRQRFYVLGYCNNTTPTSSDGYLVSSNYGANSFNLYYSQQYTSSNPNYYTNPIFKNKFKKISDDTTGFEYYQSTEGNVFKRRIYFDNILNDKKFKNKSELSEEYSMYITSTYDTIKINYKYTITASQTGCNDAKIILQYQKSDGTWDTKTIKSVGLINANQQTSNNSEETITYKISDISNSIPANEDLHFKVGMTFTESSLTYVNFYYGIETVNKIHVGTGTTSSYYANYMTFNFGSNTLERIVNTSVNRPTFIIDQINIGFPNNPTPLDSSKPQEVLKYRAIDYMFNCTDDYAQVRDSEKDYLIPITTEMASISQSVSNGIACTSIVTSTDKSSAVQVFQATPDGSSIWMQADEVGIQSNYFNLNKSGLELKGNVTLQVGNTSIDSNGVLKAKDAILEGNISANSFKASSIINYVTPDPNGGEYDLSLSLTKTTEITGDKFVISADGIISNNYDITDEPISNSLTIEVVDILQNPEGWGHFPDAEEYLYGVPTLCMTYNNIKYYLTPGCWMQNNITRDSSQIGWNKINNSILSYTFTYNSNKMYKGKYNNTYDFYIFKPGTIQKGGLDNWLYRFYVVNLGNNDITKMKTNGLVNNIQNTTNLNIINTNAVYTTRYKSNGQLNTCTINSTTRYLSNYENPAGAGAPQTNINDNILNGFKQFIINYIEGGIFYNKFIEFNNANSNTWGEKNILNAIHYIISYDSNWDEYITMDDSNLEEQYFPFINNDVFSSQSYSVDINYYPKVSFTIDNNNQNISNTINEIYIECNYNINCTYNPNNYNYVINYTKHSPSGDNGVEYTLHPTNIVIYFKYEAILQTSISNVTLNNFQQSNVESTVQSFLNENSFYSNSDKFKISFSAELTGTVNGDETSIKKTNFNPEDWSW